MPRFILRPKFARVAQATSLCLFLVLTAACASERYIGSIGRDHTYSNRGFGLTLNLAETGLLERWRVLTHHDSERVPDQLRPRLLRAPLDLNADGQFTLPETTLHPDPLLRLLARTSSSVLLSVDVRILGGEFRSRDLDALLSDELLGLGLKPNARVQRAELKLKRGYPAVSASYQRSPGHVLAKEYRLVLIDHRDLIAEQGLRRRQLIRVLLSTPQLSPELIEDQNRLLERILLAHEADKPTTGESW